MIGAMQRGIATVGLVVAALTCGVAMAQFKLGQTAKKFAFDKVWNEGPKDLPVSAARWLCSA
jgi:hypothetical protein